MRNGKYIKNILKYIKKYFLFPRRHRALNIKKKLTLVWFTFTWYMACIDQ